LKKRVYDNQQNARKHAVRKPWERDPSSYWDAWKWPKPRRRNGQPNSPSGIWLGSGKGWRKERPLVDLAEEAHGPQVGQKQPRKSGGRHRKHEGFWALNTKVTCQGRRQNNKTEGIKEEGGKGGKDFSGRRIPWGRSDQIRGSTRKGN